MTGRSDAPRSLSKNKINDQMTLTILTTIFLAQNVWRNGFILLSLQTDMCVTMMK